MNSKAVMTVAALSIAILFCISIIPMDEIEAVEQEGSNVAYVESTQQQYATLEEAYNATGSTDTVVLVDDVILTNKLTIEAGKDITLDLNNHSINDSTDHASSILIEIRGSLEVKNGTISANNSTSTYGVFTNYGTLHIVDGTYNGNPGSSANIRYVLNNVGGSVTIDNGIFQGGTGCLNNHNEGSVMTINNGEFKHTNDSTYLIQNVGEMTVNGGTFTSTSQRYNAIYNHGTLTINNVEKIECENSAVWNEGTLYIYDGSFTGKNLATIYSSGTSEIYGGTFHNKFTHDGTNNSGYTFMNDGTNASMKLSAADGKFLTVTSNFGCVYNAGGRLTIDGGRYEVLEDSGDAGTPTFYCVLTRGADAVATTTINDGEFVSFNYICIRSGISNNIQTNYRSDVTINGGNFSVVQTGVNTLLVDSDPQYPASATVNSGTFSTPLPDGVTIPSDCLKGTNSKGQTVVGQAVKITLIVNGQSTEMNIACGSCIPAEKIAEEEHGYSYTYGDYDSRETLLKTEFTQQTEITIVKTLEAPASVTIDAGGSTSLIEGQSVTLTATVPASSAADSTIVYQWYNGEQKIDGAIESNYTANTAGKYSVRAHYSAGGLNSEEVASDPIQVTVSQSKFTVTFKIEGQADTVITVPNGGSIPEDKVPVVDIPGYYFIGWMDSNDNSWEWSDDPVTQDMLITAFMAHAIDIIVEGTPYVGETVTLSVNVDTPGYDDVMHLWMYSESNDIDYAEKLSEDSTIEASKNGYYWTIVACIDTDASTMYYCLGTTLIEFTEAPADIPSEDEDLPPFVPTQPKNSGDDVTIVACAAAAVVAALMAVFLIVSYKKD